MNSIGLFEAKTKLSEICDAVSINRKAVTLTREQLYWWETSFQEALENNSLNMFLSNYSYTPEMSFQATIYSAINPEVMEWMRSTTVDGYAYEVEGL